MSKKTRRLIVGTTHRLIRGISSKYSRLANSDIPFNKGVHRIFTSPREKEALNLYLQGETARSIAEKLHLSSRTVESYLENIKNKLNCYQKTELLKKAQELKDYGLLTP